MRHLRARSSIADVRPFVELAQRRLLRRSALIVLCWLASRAFVAAALAASSHGRLSVVANWDGAWYRAIATSGYEFARDQHWHSMAFFPLYPVCVAVLLHAGASFEIAAIAVSNLAFLLTLFVVFEWLERERGLGTARWTTAFLCFCPLSLFGSVAYADSLFILCSAAALNGFSRGNHPTSGVFAALASLARPNGICLAPAFLIASLLQRRGARTAAPIAGASVGVVVMLAYGAARFGDPLAFVHAQEAWRHGIGGGADEWRTLLSIGSISFGHWRITICVAVVAAAIVVFRERLHWLPQLVLWSIVVWIEHDCWGRDFSFAVVALFGGGALVVERRRVDVAVLVYAATALVLLLGSGSTMSADRYLFAAMAFPIGVGIGTARFPCLGAPILAFCASDLFSSAEIFARAGWVA